MVSIGVSMDLISVIVTTKNRREIVPRAIDSVLRQTYPFVEVIVVDDGSTDGTAEYLRRRYPNVVVIRNDVSLGACAARNTGIQAANGVYISGLDDDDEYRENRLSVMKEAIDDDRWSFCCCHSEVVFTDGCLKPEKAVKNYVSLTDMLYSNVVGSQVLVLKERLLALHGFDESLVASQDHDMWTRLVQAYGPALKLPDTLYVCHWDDSIERVSKNKLKGQAQFFQKHYRMMTVGQKIFNSIKLLKMWGGSFV